MKLKIGEVLLGRITIDTAELGDLEDLQIQTGWPLAELRDRAEKYELTGLRIVLFLSLRAAGQPTDWDDTAKLKLTDIEFIAEPGDHAAKKTSPKAQRAGS